MQAAQLTLPAQPPAARVPTPPQVAKQPALDLRRQAVSRCWGA
jgi:hypothetical protein